MRYRTIVADPPWYYPKTGGYSWRAGLPSGASSNSGMDYPLMTLDAIAALPVHELAEPEAHLYLWTTQRYLLDAHRVAEAWGFTPKKVLVWCKPPTGFAMGGTEFGSCCEFVIFAKQGRLPLQNRVPRDWWEWSRSGGHSAKPEAFLDLVEQVSPGPYLELFARRQRLGWDTWGNEALTHVEMPA